MQLCECVRMYCFFTVLPVYVLSCAAFGVIKNDDNRLCYINSASLLLNTNFIFYAGQSYNLYSDVHFASAFEGLRP